MAPRTRTAEKPKKASGQRAPRRDARHDRNRVKLLDAAVTILLGDGMASFTSTRIAEVAGLHKPAFYAHFKNVEECLHAVASQIAQLDFEESLTLSTQGLERPDAEPALWIATIESALGNMLQHASAYRVLLRYKHAEGALGDAARAIDARVFKHWTEFFWRVAVRAGVDAKHFHEIAELAEHIVGITYFAGERLLMGRSTDVAAEAARIYRYNEAIVTTELRRMLGDPR